MPSFNTFKTAEELLKAVDDELGGSDEHEPLPVRWRVLKDRVIHTGREPSVDHLPPGWGRF